MVVSVVGIYRGFYVFASFLKKMYTRAVEGRLPVLAFAFASVLTAGILQ
jgi:hypothetical protein